MATLTATKILTMRVGNRIEHHYDLSAYSGSADQFFSGLNHVDYCFIQQKTINSLLWPSGKVIVKNVKSTGAAAEGWVKVTSQALSTGRAVVGGR